MIQQPTMRITQSAPPLWGSLIIFCLSLFLLSCKKDIKGDTSVITDEWEMPDFDSRSIASVSGFVTDENGRPATGALVRFGIAQLRTDDQGYFSFNEVEVPRHHAVLTVSKDGYFNAIKSFSVNESQPAFFRIKILPKVHIGTFDAAQGGLVRSVDDLRIIFSHGSVMYQSNGNEYTGNVQVYAQWLNPASPDLVDMMPGDWRALDASGRLKYLITYGMIAVELQAPSGEALQIASGRQADIRIPVPSGFTAHAPANIPLWHFDEQKGLWIEEGSAVLQGDHYAGSVRHFSFWNLDYPTAMVHLDMTIQDASGAPVSNAMVAISSLDGPANRSFGYTNDEGYISGFVPANRRWKLELSSSTQCLNNTSSINFQTVGSGNQSLGVIQLSSPLMMHIRGKLLNCQGGPVTQGRAILYKEGLHYEVAADDQGYFSLSYLMCTPLQQSWQLILFDEVSQQQSLPISFMLGAGEHQLGDLRACGESTEQYIFLTVNGQTSNMRMPEDSIAHLVYPGISSISIYGWRRPNFTEYMAFNINDSGIAVGSRQRMGGINSNILSFSNTTSQNYVDITEYGPVNGFMAGRFSGVVIGQGYIPQNVSFEFRVRRRR